MSYSRPLVVRAIIRADLQVLRFDPIPVVVLLVMPLLTSFVTRPNYEAAWRDRGGASGEDLAVPAAAVLFGGFTIAFVGFAVFREHGWRTWDRLRSSGISPSLLVAAKLTLPFTLVLGQQVVLLAVSEAMGMHVTGTWVALLPVAATFSVCIVAIGLALVALFDTIQKLNAAANLGALAAGAASGAFTAPHLLPGWMRAVAHATPTYWAIEAYERVIVGGGGVGAVLGPCLALAGLTALALAVVAWRFELDEAKVSWVG